MGVASAREFRGSTAHGDNADGSFFESTFQKRVYANFRDPVAYFNAAMIDYLYVTHK
jgi:hypothetical protein